MIAYTKHEAGYLEISASGRITRDEVEQLWTRLKADIPPDGKVKVLEIIGPFDGIEPTALWEDLKRGWPMIDRVSHAAIVADQTWITLSTKLAAVFVSAKVLTFHRDQEGEARAWLASV